MQVFMPEGKRQVIGKGGARPVTLIEDGPGALCAAAVAYMLLRYAASQAHRSTYAERLGPGRPSPPVWCPGGSSFPGRPRC